MKINDHGRYFILDGMRGIAAIAVMIFHFTSHYDYEVFKNAPIAVDLFFMLSGFVLCYSYGDKVLNARISFGDFMTRRVIRLYPMFLLGLILGTAGLYLLTKFGHTNYTLHEVASAFGCNLLFLPYFNTGMMHLFERAAESPGDIFPTNGSAWSLFSEMFVNLFFFMLVTQPRKKLFAIAVGAFALLTFLGALDAFSSYSYKIDIDAGWGTTNFLAGIPRVFFGFTMGILIYKFASVKNAIDGIRNAPLQTVIKFLGNYPTLLFILLIGLFLIPVGLKGVTALISIAILCPLIILIGSTAIADNRIVLNVSKFLGWISYPLYCLHAPIGNLVAIANNEGGLAAMLPLPFAVVASLASIVASILFTLIYDEPVRTALSRKAKSLLWT